MDAQLISSVGKQCESYEDRPELFEPWRRHVSDAFMFSGELESILTQCWQWMFARMQRLSEREAGRKVQSAADMRDLLMHPGLSDMSGSTARGLDEITRGFQTGLMLSAFQLGYLVAQAEAGRSVDEVVSTFTANANKGGGI